MADTTKKLLDLAGLQTFTGLMKQYVDEKVNDLGGSGGDTGTSELTPRVEALEETVGNLETTVGDLETTVGDLGGRDVYVKSEVDSAIAEAKKAGTDASELLDEYKIEVGNTYAIKNDVNSALDGKADNSDVETLKTRVSTLETVKAINAFDYSEAVDLSKNLVAGQLIDVTSEEEITTGEGENQVTITYKAGFYIVETPGTISALDTSTGASDEVGALKIRVDALEGNRVLNSDFDAYKTEVTNGLATKADADDLTTHTENATIHVTTEDKAKWDNAEQNAKNYADSLASNYDAAGSAAAVLGTSSDNKDAVTVYGVKAYVDSKNSAMVARVDDLEETVGNLETTVSDENTGLVKKVNDLETTVGDAESESGLVKDVTANRADIDKLIALFEWGQTEE